MLDQETITAITSKVVRQYPEMVSIKPLVRAQVRTDQDRQLKTAQHKNMIWVLTYSRKVLSQTGAAIKRHVRVTVNEQGKILKITTSK